MSESDYIPVPVTAAREVAEHYEKAVVVILAWDAGASVLHTTTYGRTAEQKQWAARLGEIVSRAAGVDLSAAKNFEDFRTRTQAEWAVEREKLLKAAKLAFHTIASLRAVRDGIPDARLDESVEFIRGAYETTSGESLPR